jgi:alkanesulfonate monooxygenase SsuD/methylene tetrahydromethanopterin reductase-like flavin-dependent oxidoreductase (luciferase family)
MPQEFAVAGVPLSRRGAGMDDAIAAMRACWGPDPVVYEGRFYRIPESEINPKPVQAHLPIIIGATTPAGIARAARIADGLNPIAFSAETVVGSATAFREAAKAAGRDADRLTVVVRANVPITAEPLGDDRPFLGGSPEQIAADLGQLAGHGINEVLFANMAATGDVDAELRLLDRLRSTAG